MKITTSYTQTPNYIYDNLLQHLTGSQAAVVSVIVRQTAGWHRDASYLSITQLAALSGKHRSTIIRAVRELERACVIRKHVSGGVGRQSSLYALADISHITSISQQSSREMSQSLSIGEQNQKKTYRKKRIASLNADQSASNFPANIANLSPQKDNKIFEKSSSDFLKNDRLKEPAPSQNATGLLARNPLIINDPKKGVPVAFCDYIKERKQKERTTAAALSHDETSKRAQEQESSRARELKSKSPLPSAKKSTHKIDNSSADDKKSTHKINDRLCLSELSVSEATIRWIYNHYNDIIINDAKSWILANLNKIKCVDAALKWACKERPLLKKQVSQDLVDERRKKALNVFDGQRMGVGVWCACNSYLEYVVGSTSHVIQVRYDDNDYVDRVREIIDKYKTTKR